MSCIFSRTLLRSLPVSASWLVLDMINDKSVHESQHYAHSTSAYLPPYYLHMQHATKVQPKKESKRDRNKNHKGAVRCSCACTRVRDCCTGAPYRHKLSLLIHEAPRKISVQTSERIFDIDIDIYRTIFIVVVVFTP